MALTDDLTDDLGQQTGQPEDEQSRQQRLRLMLLSGLKSTLPPRQAGDAEQPGPFSEEIPAAKLAIGSNVRPNLRPNRMDAPTEAPDIFAPPTGPAPQLLGRRNTGNLLGRGLRANLPPFAKPGMAGDTGGLDAPLPQPTKPNDMPTREAFPAKPELSGWKKVLGLGAAFATGSPQLADAVLHGQQEKADRQYGRAFKDWQGQQAGEEKQAQISEIQARTRALNNPQPKEGQTPEETTIHDLMTGDNGQPRVNPDTQKPYSYLEAYSAIQGAKSGAAQGAKQPALDADTVSQINDMHAQRYQVLNPNKPLPPALTLRQGAKQADYERIDKNLTQMESAQGTQAQRESTNTARAQAQQDREQARQDRQQQQDLQSVIAYDPKTKERVLVTAGEAKQRGLQVATKATTADEEKAGEFNAQANDVQMNASRYRASLNAVRTPFSKIDTFNATQILADPQVNNFLLQAAGFPMVMSQITQGDKAKAWNALPPDKQNAVVGYLRMKGAAIAYQKMLTNQGRTSKEGLDIELANIPSPIIGATAANKQLDAFQENIDTAAQRSVRLPWMETPKDVRARIEKQSVNQYNQEQESKPKGRYQGFPSQDTGRKTYQPGMVVEGIPGLTGKVVSKVYPDGSFDVK